MFADRTNWNLAPNRLSEALARHRAHSRLLIDLTASNPTACGFHYDAGAILQALQKPEALSYNPEPRGLASARAAVAGYYRDHDIALSVEDIILTASTSEAYSFVFRALCNPGDEFLVPAPSYPLFEYLADIQDVKLLTYTLLYDHGWQLDFHAIEKAATPRTRGVIVVNPNNPTGNYIKRTELDALGGLCSARGMALVSDEVFLDFALETGLPCTFAANDRALTFTLSGLSKISGLPQMKTAWLIVSGPSQLKARALERLEVIADTYLSVNTPVQLALPQWLHQRQVFQQQLMSRVRSNLAALDTQIQLHKTVSRLRIEGGWYAVLRVPATRADEDLAIAALEQKDVYVHPGHFFNFPSDGYIIVSLIVPEKEFAEGVKRLLSVV